MDEAQAEEEYHIWEAETYGFSQWERGMMPV
jgi:hypothetical protein